MSARPHVLIVVGGFSGLATARALARAPVEVTLLDRQNHHLFPPLLYDRSARHILGRGRPPGRGP